MRPVKFDWEHFRCKKCGKCCIGISLPWPGYRLNEIAEFLKITSDELVTRYIGRIIEKDGKKSIERYETGKNSSCPFDLIPLTCASL